MNLLTLRLNIPAVKDNLIKGVYKTINYTIMLNEARIQDYNHSILIPQKTIIICDAKKIILEKDFDDKEITIITPQKELIKEYETLKTNKKINTGLIRTHEIIDEITNNTPIYYNKDSISESLELIDMTNNMRNYERVIPHTLLDEYMNTIKSMEKIKPINNKYNIASLKNGFSLSGPDYKTARDGFRIKHHSEKNTYEFNNQGIPFYTLGQLGKLSNELNNIWNR